MASILILDDQPGVRSLLLAVAESAGHRVVEASESEAALGLVRSERPDLVIADILMPGMDGYDFVRELRRDPALRSTRVIFCSATFMEDEARRLAASCGVEHILVKPFEVQAIADAIEGGLNAGPLDTDGGLASANFDREHLRVLNSKLIAKLQELEQLAARHARVNEELRASELRHRVLFEHNPLPVLVYDRATLEIVEVNEALIASHGYAREELLGMTIEELHPQADVGGLRAFLANAGGPQAPSGDGVRVRGWLHRRKDGTTIEVEITSANLTFGGRACRLALLNDVTERNRAAVELARARDEAVEASSMKSAFLANVSHEIRTPMNGVIGMNELLLETDLTEQQRFYAETVARSGEQMMRIVNDVLDVSKIEAGQLDLDVANFALHDAVRDACAAAAAAAGEKNVLFNLEIDSMVPLTVAGDGRRLRQVLENLVSNAVKFTDVGTVTVRVGAKPHPEGVTVRCEVLDTGIGVAPEAISRMFELFTQADASSTRRHGGTGLGLALARELVEMMGGAIGADSEPGRGSTFWFEVALRACDPAAGPTEMPPQTESPTLRLGPNAPLVLVADDSSVSQIVAVRTLARCGCRADVVSDGHKALQALAARCYDAVLMDCHMPVMNGYEATVELRARERNGRHTPIIAMSAKAMQRDREKCLAAGMDDCISKPMRYAELADALQRWLSRPADGQLVRP